MLEHRGERRARDGFGRGRFGGHHRGGRGARLGRFLEHGDLRWVLLQMIAEKPRHGYELIKAIEDKLGGMYSPSPGVVYPTLTLLEELGYLRAESVGGNRKLYSMTAEGTDFLAANYALVEAVATRRDQARQTYRGRPAPRRRRAKPTLHPGPSVRPGRGPPASAPGHP